MATREERVAEFHQAGSNGTMTQGGSLPLMVACFSEELVEFNEAMANYATDPSEDTRANLVKEWADVQYTLSALAYFYEIDGEEAFNRVADNNMTKVDASGVIIKRPDGKILKPVNYEPADMKGL